MPFAPCNKACPTLSLEPSTVIPPLEGSIWVTSQAPSAFCFLAAARTCPFMSTTKSSLNPPSMNTLFPVRLDSEKLVSVPPVSGGVFVAA